MLYFNSKINKFFSWHPKFFEIGKVIFSLITQTVSSENLKIIDTVARLTRSVHDQTIFNSFHLEVKVEIGIYDKDSNLVADGEHANTAFIV